MQTYKDGICTLGLDRKHSRMAVSLTSETTTTCPFSVPHPPPPAKYEL